MIRLLLVDDHPSSRIPLALVLEREPDMTVVAQAGSLAEAREALEGLDESGETVDVALLDLELPDGIGTELVGDLRAVNPLCSALILTAHTTREEHARAVDAGASGVLNKAASLEEVLDAIRRLHSGEALMPQDEFLDMVRVAVRLRKQDLDARVALGQITPRELEILQALADGLNDKEMGERLHISPGTVRSHLTSILKKFGVESRLQALVFALRYGAIELPRKSGE